MTKEINVPCSLVGDVLNVVVPGETLVDLRVSHSMVEEIIFYQQKFVSSLLHTSYSYSVRRHYLYMLAFILHRGQHFRPEFSLLGQSRSIVPQRVQFIAPTATASEETYRAVRNQFFLSNPQIVALSPENKNIIYTVSIKKSTYGRRQNILCMPFRLNAALYFLGAAAGPYIIVILT